jgi:hypothetical protein
LRPWGLIGFEIFWTYAISLAAQTLRPGLIKAQ